MRPFRTQRKSGPGCRRGHARWRLGTWLTAWIAAFLCALPVPQTAHADALGAEALLLTAHVQSQRDAPVKRYTRRLDEDGQYVFTPGVEAYYDRALESPWLGARELRFSAGVLQDSALHWFFYTAVMARWELIAADSFTLSLHLGPGFMARESWRDIPEYDPDNAFNESDTFLPGYEWIFLPLGEIDALFRLNSDWEAVWSVFPGIPYVITQAVGLRRSF